MISGSNLINMSQIIRACELEKDDIFIKLGIRYRVARIRDGKIESGSTGWVQDRTGTICSFIGIKSQERVELLSKAVIRTKPYRGGKIKKKQTVSL